MITCIAGSRDIYDNAANLLILEDVISQLPWKISTVVSGMASGADSLGETWAKKHNILVNRKPADWKTYGKRAGMIRNSQMARESEAVVCLWDGVSRGTKNMFETSIERGLPVCVATIGGGKILSVNFSNIKTLTVL